MRNLKVKIVLYSVLLQIVLVLCMDKAAMAASDEARNSIGVNKFDLFMQYIGTASRGNGSEAYQRVTRAMARKALEDAQEAGIRLVRVSVVGYSPARYGGRRDLELWMTDPDVFWGKMDEMFNDLDETNIQLIPVLMWNAAQFPAMAGETVGDLIRNQDSKSWQLLASYVADFIRRYRDRRTIAFYELTNELNLLVDIDNVSRCEQQRPGQCQISANFTTDELIGFTKRYAGLIRKLDDSRKISSGFSVPRASAENLRVSRHRGERPDWTPDTRAQFRKNLKEIHAAVDILSIHLYAGKQNQRFGTATEMEVLAEAKLASAEVGKPLFVGEFGEPDIRAATSDSYTAQMINRIVELDIPYSAIWAWEFYQHKLFKEDRRDHAFNLEPGYADLLIERLRASNQKRAPNGKTFLTDSVPPRVILTWPLECAIVKLPANLHVVASDNSGKIKQVEFLLNGNRLSTDEEPPYEATIQQETVKPGRYRLTAKGYDFTGNVSEFSSTILVGNSDLECAAPH